MPKATTRKPPAELGYEAALAELEKIVAALEAGKVSLEESMQLFERAQQLIAHCTSLLEQAELTVRKLEGGNLEAFEDEGP